MENTRRSSFLTRLRSGAVLLGMLVLLLVWGGTPLYLGIALISLVGLGELYRADGFSRTGLAVTGYVSAVIFEVLTWLELTGRLPGGAAASADLSAAAELSGTGGIAGIMTGMDWLPAYAAGVLILLLAVYVFAYPRYDAGQAAMTGFGLLYVVFSLSFILRIRAMDTGAYLVWLVFICSWGADTMAYCTGMLLGRHKLAPVLSPKKTVEGAVGGVMLTALLGAAYTLLFRRQLPLGPGAAALVCGVGAMISMVGDLAASAIKRNREIKDYGTLIPGHGGILDRFDSVIITAPILYYLLALLG